MLNLHTFLTLYFRQNKLVIHLNNSEIIIDKVVKEDDKFIYFLDMKHLC